MPFDALPEFTQGGQARAEMGAMGIPLESLQAPPMQPAGQSTPQSQPGEDVIGREVDALTGIHPMPPAQPAAPVRPDTQPPSPYAPAFLPDTQRVPLNTSERSINDRIVAIHNKYGGSFEKLAEAHVHSEAARTRAQQDRSGDIASLRNEFRDQTSRLEALILQGRSATMPSSRSGNGQGYGAVPVSPGNGVPAVDPELFQRDPAAAIVGVVAPLLEESNSRHTRALADALAQQRQLDRQEQWEIQQRDQLQRLRPLMEQIYAEKPHLYQNLYPQHRDQLLFEAAKDRAQALQGQQFYAEMTEVLGNGGTPGGISPAPPQSGALPGSAGAGARRPGPAPSGDWGNTRNMNQLWRSTTETGEMRAVTDVLRERGFGEQIPLE